ncbi:outer membrane protein assembly factor BamA [Alphaproteobacteria bacterium LSUCC0684]
MKKLAFLFVIMAVIGWTGLSSETYAQNNPAPVAKINVEGAQRIDPETVLAYAAVRVGESLSDRELNSILSRLYDTELFNDVMIDFSEGILTITVDENPIINRISLEGNDVLKDEQLLEIINIKPRRVYTDKLALDTKNTLMEVYRQSGRYAAIINPKIIELPDKRVDLVFEIDEGPLIKIKAIKFIGNERFSDRALKSVIQSRETKWYIFFTANDKYDPGRLRLDTQNLRQFYLENGYAEIDIVRATGELLPDRSGFVLTFQISEGDQYAVAEVAINSEIEGLEGSALEEYITLERGEIYDTRVMEETLGEITNALGTLGYAFVNVAPQFDLDNEAKTLDVMINIASSQRNYVEEISIKGNDRTLDSVIRREFELVEGDSFNQLKLTQSERNVRNLGYFSKVSVNVQPGSSEEQSIVEMNVEETATGTFAIGFGYSTFDQGSLSLGINENNFLGTGKGARASLSVSGKKTNFRAGITEPHLFDRNLLGSFDIFKDESEVSDVTTEKGGFDFGFGFSAAGNYRHRVGYLLAETKTRTSSTTSASTSGDEGTLLVSEVSYTISKDTRDNRIDPRKGYLLRATQSLAGLGGDVTYASTVLRGQYLKPLLFGTYVIGVDGETGFIDGLGEKVTRSNRFQIGGRKLRGFGGSGIGPRDTGDDTAVGGNNYYIASLNLTSDAGFDKDLGLRWTVFTDIGSLWGTDYPANVRGANDSSMRSSLGYGLLWDTAIGPMSFIWAFPLEKKSYDKTKVFQFSFGGRF